MTTPAGHGLLLHSHPASAADHCISSPAVKQKMFPPSRAAVSDDLRDVHQTGIINARQSATYSVGGSSSFHTTCTSKGFPHPPPAVSGRYFLY
jgi:hypothetical protein